MEKDQLEKLLSLYKKAVENNLTAGEFKAELLAAQIQLDKSFVETGNKDKNLGQFIDELYQLEKLATNE